MYKRVGDKLKKRLIPKKDIQKAYTKDLSFGDIELDKRDTKDDIDILPDEIFEILGQVISFVEKTNKLEGDINENK